MKSTTGIGLENVQGVYSGAEGRLWELIMGEQIHIGGFASSMELSQTAGVGPGGRGVDLCCCTGAGMRFLIRFAGVDSMHGVDATETVVRLGQKRCAEEGLADRIRFTLADACDSKLPDGKEDFVWGEDAWCYVADKARLISEAARIVRPGGTIAFTDWIEGGVPLSAEEARRFLTFMKFPNIQDLGGYRQLLESAGCGVSVAKLTPRFAPCVDLYIDMLEKQLAYDALKIIGFDMGLMQTLAGEMKFMQNLAREGKIAQGMFVARREK